MEKILTPHKAKRAEELSKTKKVTGSEVYVKQNPSDDELRTAAVNEVMKESPNIRGNLDHFVRKVADKFVEMKLHQFPKLCQETRRVNYLKRQELKHMGNEKGWSDKKTMMVDYVIPRELYLFMLNMIYREFWAEENEKVWRSFMKGIMRGEDPETLLIAVKMHYTGARDREELRGYDGTHL